MILRIFLIFVISELLCSAAYAKEPFNIMGIQIGDSIASLKKVFPEIIIKPKLNMANCKNEDFVIQNGSTFTAFKEGKDRTYSFHLIFVNGVQTVTRAKFSYVSTSVSKELFLSRLKEKYDMTVINEDNLHKAKYAMADYAAISHFVVPEGHFFKIEDEDIFRLQYTSIEAKQIEAGNLVHTIVIESRNYNNLDEFQRKLGKEDKAKKEEECGKMELNMLGF
tara:strand:- start:341 stop:1006 length:666 start_codon:yes stop_codon:yes gene_type:complete